MPETTTITSKEFSNNNSNNRKKKPTWNTLKLMMIGAFQMKPHRICLRFFLSHSFVGDFTDYCEKFSFTFSHIALFSCIYSKSKSNNSACLVHVINFFQFNKLFPFSFARMSAFRFTVSLLLILSLRISFIQCTLPVGFWLEFFFLFISVVNFPICWSFLRVFVVDICVFAKAHTRAPHTVHTHTNSI